MKTRIIANPLLNVMGGLVWINVDSRNHLAILHYGKYGVILIHHYVLDVSAVYIHGLLISCLQHETHVAEVDALHLEIVSCVHSSSQLLY